MKSDDSIPKLTQQQLQAVKAKLVAKREKLNNELKTKHSAAYNWFVAHNIDLNNLQKYSKNIAALVTLANQLVTGQHAFIPVPKPVPAVKADNEDNSTVLAQDQVDNSVKAQKVWEDYGEIIKQVAQKYNLDPQLIFATIMTESEGNPESYRYEPHIDDASYGLGQILYSTAVSLGFTGKPEDIYRPEIAIDLIGKFHKNTIDTYGELTPERMTVVYNTGQLFGYPTYGHLARFKEWYYNYKKEAAVQQPVV